MKVETDIITIISTSLIGQAVILVIMYAETFKTDIIKSPKQSLETYCFSSVSYYY